MLVLATGAAALASCVPTGERPSLEAGTTSEPTVLGSVVERETPPPETVVVTTTTAAPTTTAPPTTTTLPTTTTAAVTTATVGGTYVARASGSSVDIALDRSTGGTVARRSATSSNRPVQFSFTDVAPGRYRVVITETSPGDDTSSISVVRTVVFQLAAGGHANISCAPDGCSVAV